MMRTLELPAGVDPRTWGRVHGESFRHEIGALADIRVYLTQRVGGFSTDEEVLRVAEAHLPILERYDRALYDELCGIAEGAATTAARIVVLNHYTDLRDIDPSAVGPRSLGAPASDDGCSIVYANTEEGPVLAQTWDMHATAIPFTMMLRVPESEQGPEAWLLTLTGCLGMCGLTRRGLAIAINNLHSTDARVGVVWPALVRRALREPDAAAARDRILEAPVGSGHHYFVADDASAYGIETSGRLREVVFEGRGDEPYVHTNHCTSEVVAAHSRVPPTSSTHERYARLSQDVRDEPIESTLDAWERLGDCEGFPRSVCSYLATPQNPHGTATCAGVSIDIGARVIWAQGGLTHNVAPDRFAFGEEDAP
jgi:isopenicillin-N N-acyltransferase like protein